MEKKQNNIWQANEENYSKRLKEDRKLRKEGWQVFGLAIGKFAMKI